jgi:hypothetical protein
VFWEGGICTSLPSILYSRHVRKKAERKKKGQVDAASPLLESMKANLPYDLLTSNNIVQNHTCFDSRGCFRGAGRRFGHQEVLTTK